MFYRSVDSPYIVFEIEKDRISGRVGGAGGRSVGDSSSLWAGRYSYSTLPSKVYLQVKGLHTEHKVANVDTQV